MCKMATIHALVGVLAFSIVFASNVPVLMWSPERPLSDLPQAPAADSVSQDTFHTEYLKPLLNKGSNVLVAFLQDKLHVSDISKYADVYNENSDGGAFKNIKGLLDDNFSLELPQVLNSHLALDALRQNFPGTVHDLASATDLSGLDLSGKGNYLLIVRLTPVAGAKNEEAAISANDELVGQVSNHLKKRSVQYTALYTAETSEAREKRDTRKSRHLLATADQSQEGAFYNVSYGNGTLYAYLKSVSVCVLPKTDPPPTACSANFTVPADKLLTNSNMTAVMGENRTLTVTLTIFGISPNSTNLNYTISIKFPFRHWYDRWEMEAAMLTLKNGSELVNDDDMLVTRGYDMVVPLLYSFHCSSMQWYVSTKANSSQTQVTLGGFQIQPFNTTEGFRLSQDCVGWFSTAIWMALVPVGLNIIILLFGMYMLSSLTTNDRFDDPKSKPLNINAGE
ncbi:V-type proton ATPase subunit S1-like [Littorina saxatilis]|uniref:V-type proton ATPase subunit S1 n=1 Tax=Littorina saxatilis TaxID=31220 RepID=A0AAN9BDZ0_9CAEN